MEYFNFFCAHMIDSYFFRFWPLVALVSIFGHPHTYIWNQLDEFYQMSTKNRDSIFEPQKREHPKYESYSIDGRLTP